MCLLQPGPGPVDHSQVDTVMKINYWQLLCVCMSVSAAAAAAASCVHVPVQRVCARQEGNLV
jgi:hypothetical protein